MLPLPPAFEDVPVSEAAKLSRRKWTLLKIAGVGSIAGCLLILAAPLLMFRTRCGNPRTEPVGNLRQLGLALSEFETEYGSFPDTATIERVREQSESSHPMRTTSSNDFFRQLLASGIVQSESLFYARISGVRKPDGFFVGENALEKGECGFTYFLGAEPTDNPSRPLIAAPMIPGTDRFDPDPFEGKALILKLDNSVMSCDIDRHGHVIFHGRNLMDPNHPVWDGHAPVIAWPDF